MRLYVEGGPGVQARLSMLQPCRTERRWACQQAYAPACHLLGPYCRRFVQVHNCRCQPACRRLPPVINKISHANSCRKQLFGSSSRQGRSRPPCSQRADICKFCTAATAITSDPETYNNSAGSVALNLLCVVYRLKEMHMWLPQSESRAIMQGSLCAM